MHSNYSASTRHHYHRIEVSSTDIAAIQVNADVPIVVIVIAKHRSGGRSGGWWGGGVPPDPLTIVDSWVCQNQIKYV